MPIDLNLIENNSDEAMPDMCICYECNGEFELEDCERHHEVLDDREEEMVLPIQITVHCPDCPDGGSINELFFSDGEHPPIKIGDF